MKPTGSIAGMALLLLSAVGAVSAAEIRSVRPLWGNQVRKGQWVPVEVGTENRAAATDLDLALEFNSDTRTARYYTRVNLPSNSRKKVIVYGIAEDPGSGVTARIPGWKARELNFTALNANDGLVGVVSQEEGSLGFLGSLGTVGRPVLDSGLGFGASYSVQGRLYVHTAKPLELPDRWVGYDMLRVLVWLNASPRELDETRTTALMKWIAAGGTLVVCGGSEWQRLREGFLPEVLPVRPNGSRVLDRSQALVRRYGRPLGNDPLVITTGTVTGGALVYAWEGNQPLIVRRHFGAGSVVWLAFDPSRPPLAGWEGSPALWRDVLKWAEERPRFVDPGAEVSVGGWQAAGPRGRMRWMGPQSEDYMSLVSSFAQDRREMRAPAFEVIAIFLAAYLFCLVPLNYFVLKRFDKREWAWISTPTIVVLFTLLSYGVGYSLKGGVLILSKLTIVQSHDGETSGRSDTLFGIFSPGKRSYTITTGDLDATVTDIPSGETAAQRAYLRVNEDRGFRVEDAAINMWTMRMFQSHAAVKLGRGVRARFALSNGVPVVTVFNETGLSLSESYVVSGLGNATLGPLPSGKSATGTLTAGSTNLNWSSAVRAAAVAQLGLLDANRQLAHAGGAEALFLGWTDTAVDTVRVQQEQPEQSAQTLVAIRLPVEFAGGGMGVQRNAIPGEVIESKSSQQLSLNTTFLPGTGNVRELTLPDGWLVYEIKLPYAGHDFVPRQLTLHVDFGNPRGTASVYNFAEHRWEPLEEEVAGRLPGQSRGYPLDRAGQYVLQPDNVVRVRIDAGRAKEVRLRTVSADVTGSLTRRR